MTKSTLLNTAAKAFNKRKSNNMPTEDKTYNLYERKLTIKADNPEVANQIQQSLQQIIEKANPSAIENLAKTLAKKPKLVDTAVQWLPFIS